MFTSSNQSKNVRLLILNLVLIVFCIAGLGLLITVYYIFTYSHSSVTSTVTRTPRPTTTQLPVLSYTPSPTVTDTPHPSLTPTITQTPTNTAQFSETPTTTGLPTLTPAPPAVLSSAYQLKPWSPEMADYMARLLQGFPDTLQSRTTSDDKNAYYRAFKYPILAFQEAILRFPDSRQVSQWRWNLANNLALTGDSKATSLYAALLADSLNSGEANIENLYTWFSVLEPNMQLHMTEIKPPPGKVSAWILEVRSKGGSGFIELMESSTGYNTHPIYSHFDFENALQANWIVTDLDRIPDNGEELASYSSNLAGQFLLEAPHIFMLNSVPNNSLPFLPIGGLFNVGMDFTNYWSVIKDSSGKNDLVFDSTIYPPCPVNIQKYYRWNRLYFENTKSQYKFRDKPLDLSRCETMVNHAAETWGPEAAIPLMESLLPDWPPAKDIEGNPYPADAKDEWRYRLGVYNALLGDWETSIRYFNQVSTDPTVQNSSWITPSQEFLALYQKSVDIYKVCLLTEFCDPGHAIGLLVGNIQAEDDALQYLWKSGLKTNSSGWFDFDGDDEPERWFTVRHRPRGRLELWILAKFSGGIKALEVAFTDAIQPTMDYLEEAYISDEGLSLQPVVMLDGKYAFSMRRMPDDQEPYLVEVPLRKEFPNRFLVPLESYEKALLEGANAQVIQQKLVNLEENPGLLCKPTWSCDRYFYILGLASELAGDELSAVEAYHRLWSDYSKSPFTTMARLKLSSLGEIIFPTAVSSSTPTNTGIPSTPTLTITGTATQATPTFTQTSEPSKTVTTSPTPTTTETPTVEPYVPPTPWPTFTPYPTP